MKLIEALEKINSYIKRTQKPASEAVRDLWDKLTPIEKEDAERLMQMALASLATVAYKSEIPLSVATGSSSHQVQVRHSSLAIKHYEVTVELLANVHYVVGGKVKAVATFNRMDALELADNSRRMKEGHARYEEMWRHVAQRLQTCKKSCVHDLGEGEQLKIARMINEIRSGGGGTELTDGNKVVLDRSGQAGH